MVADEDVEVVVIPDQEVIEAIESNHKFAADILPSPQNTATQGIVLPEVNPLELEGKLTISGSQVVFPINQAIAQRFIQNGYPDKISITAVDTEIGFKLFCSEKNVDIVSAVIHHQKKIPPHRRRLYR